MDQTAIASVDVVRQPPAQAPREPTPVPRAADQSHAGYTAKDAGYFGNPRKDLIDLLPAGIDRLLDVGCGEGGFGRSAMARHDGIEVWGIELQASAAEVARQGLHRVICGSIEDSIAQLPDGYFDCISFNDVLEHLVDPWAVLKLVKTKLSPKGFVFASIPNLRYAPVMKALFWHGEFEYTERGVLDVTHLRFFTRKGIHQLMEKSGYAIAKIDGLQWAFFSWPFILLNRLLRRRFDDMHYLQFVVQARPV